MIHRESGLPIRITAIDWIKIIGVMFAHGLTITVLVIGAFWNLSDRVLTIEMTMKYNAEILTSQNSSLNILVENQSKVIKILENREAFVVPKESK